MPPSWTAVFALAGYIFAFVCISSVFSAFLMHSCLVAFYGKCILLRFDNILCIFKSAAFWKKVAFSCILTCCILRAFMCCILVHSGPAAFFTCCILMHSICILYLLHSESAAFCCILRPVCIMMHSTIVAFFDALHSLAFLCMQRFSTEYGQVGIWCIHDLLHFYTFWCILHWLHSVLVAFTYIHYAFNKCCIPLTCCILWLVAYKCIYVHVPTGCILETYMHQNASECTRM